MTDISREAVEREFPNTKQPHGEMLLALRAALDRADADKAAAVAAERERCAAECDAVARRYSKSGFGQAEIGAETCAAAIRAGGDK